jgi:hypothetical protein
MDLGKLKDILGKYGNSTTESMPLNVESDYAKVAENAPPAHLATSLAEAFRSNYIPHWFRRLVSVRSL